MVRSYILSEKARYVLMKHLKGETLTEAEAKHRRVLLCRIEEAYSQLKEDFELIEKLKEKN